MASIWELAIEEITADHVERLVSDQQSESIYLEFKGELDLKPDKQKREAAKDVAAFANARGGLLIYGVTEKEIDDGRKVASGTNALPDGGIADRFLDTVLGRTEPPARPRVRLVPASGGGFYLVVKIDPSFHALHAADGRYYARSDKGAHPMSAAEVQNRHEQLFQVRQSGEQRALAIGRVETTSIGTIPWLGLVVVPLAFTGEVALEDLTREHFVAPDLPDPRGLSATYEFQHASDAYEAIIPKTGHPGYGIRLRRDGALHVGNEIFCDETFFRDKVIAALCLKAVRMARYLWARLGIRGPAAVFVVVRTNRELAMAEDRHVPEGMRATVTTLNLSFVVSYPDGLDDGSRLAATVLNRIAQVCKRPRSRLVRPDGTLMPTSDWPAE